MFRKTLSKLYLGVMVFTITFALAPASAMAQKGGGGSGGGGSGGGGGGGSRDLPSLQATLDTVCLDDPFAYGQATASPNALGDGQSFTMQIDNVSSTTTVSVYINGGFLGYIDLNESGDGSSLYTIGYYGGTNPITAPIIHAGDEIEVFDALDDACLLTGTFR